VKSATENSSTTRRTKSGILVFILILAAALLPWWHSHDSLSSTTYNPYWGDKTTNTDISLNVFLWGFWVRTQTDKTPFLGENLKVNDLFLVFRWENPAIWAFNGPATRLGICFGLIILAGLFVLVGSLSKRFGGAASILFGAFLLLLAILIFYQDFSALANGHVNGEYSNAYGGRWNSWLNQSSWGLGLGFYVSIVALLVGLSGACVAIIRKAKPKLKAYRKEENNGGTAVNATKTLETLLKEPQRQERLKTKTECGNCDYYLKSECPRAYDDDREIWRAQKTCDLFRARYTSSST